MLTIHGLLSNVFSAFMPHFKSSGLAVVEIYVIDPAYVVSHPFQLFFQRDLTFLKFIKCQIHILHLNYF